MPVEAFEAAVAEATTYSADPLLQSVAVEVASLSNDRNAQGMLGLVDTSAATHHFSGTIFIVVRDPKFSADGRFISATNYYVAAIELSGTAAWVGGQAHVTMKGGQAGGIKHQCCGPSTICVPQAENPNPCGPDSYCPALSGDVGITTIHPQPMDERIGSGMPMVDLMLFPDHSSYDASVIPASALTGIKLGNLYTCSEVRDPVCDVSKPTCDLGDDGVVTNDTGGGDYGSGTNICVGSGQHEPSCLNCGPVPKFCTQIMGGPENVPPECGGLCTNCGGLSLDITHMILGCELVRTVDGSDMCQPPAVRAANAAGNNQYLQVQVGFMGQATEVCQPAPGFMEQCTTCDAGGNCHVSVRKPEIDPRAASSNTSSNQCSGTVTCQFDPVKIEGEIDTPTATAAAPQPATVTPAAPPPPPTATAPPQRQHVFDPSEVKGDINGKNNSRESQSSQPAGLPPVNREPVGDPPVKTNEPPRFFDFLDFFRTERDQNTSGDPVALGDGSYQIAQTDLSMEGPVRPLQFARTYNSGSSERSILGSNWFSNWDIRIQPLWYETTPSWTLPYCAGTATVTTCLLLYRPDGGVQLFFLDMGSGLYMPQAGSTDTISVTVADDGTSGWALRSADGHILYFNTDGYLVNDRDRFGNGFTVEYEQTPLYSMYQYYCGTAALAARNETLHSQRCAILAHYMAGIEAPLSTSDAWGVTSAMYPNPPTTDPDYDRIVYGRAYFFYLLSLNRALDTSFGQLHLRPTRITDDLGRTLSFSYYTAAPVSTPPGGMATFDFAVLPQSELLKEVRASTGITLQFRYDRPSNHPAELNEMFLVETARHDTPTAVDIAPAPDRTSQYIYDWRANDQPVGSSAGLDVLTQDAQQVYSAYFDYFQTFTACALQPTSVCSVLALSEIVPGSPGDAAREAQDGFLSRVADNIIQVITNNVSESETRYDDQAFSSTFDHVLFQRYGSSQADSSGIAALPDQPGDFWQTGLPKASFEYLSAGPVSDQEPESDMTDASAFLPQAIRDRYPLETFTGTLPQPPNHPLVGAKSPPVGLVACDYNMMEILRTELPGYRASLPYYDPAAAETQPDFSRAIFRTHLTCDQLALAQLSSPTHNDLVSELEPDLSTTPTFDYVAERIIGNRPTIAANINRICGWVKMVNRDGVTTYYGLNYRGQVLVTAVENKTTGEFIFTEQLYNADGLVVQERRPTSGQHHWEAADGYTLYRYDEIDPTQNNHWNEWLPVYWTRRTNLVRVEEHPSAFSVTDADETTSSVFTTSMGRYKKIFYEPLFNQVRYVEEGSIELRPSPTTLTTAPTDIPHQRQEFIFDYQELDLSSNAAADVSMTPVLDNLSAWGFNWVQSDITPFPYDYATIKAWQIPLTFYNDDLNGDGVQGFGFGAQAYQRARGVPVESIIYSANPADTPQVTRMVWAPNGQIARIAAPDQAITVFEYYTIGNSTTSDQDRYGRDRAPLNAEVSSGYGGLLARIQSRRSGGTDAAYGPQTAPCSSLAGPYQWLLPDSCSAQPENELLALGLPQETVDAILTSLDHTSGEAWATTSFSYSPFGETRYVWTDTTQSHTMRDTDGRILSNVDALGSTTTFTYTLQGYPEQTIISDKNGTSLRETYRLFDDEGRVIYECNAKAANGCQPLGTRDPNGIVSTYTYYPEGALRTATDPEGLVTTYGYDERGLLTTESAANPTNASGTHTAQYTYTLDGDLSRTDYLPLVAPLTAPLFEAYHYDGLRRLSTYTDTRGTDWQMTFSNRDLLIGYRQGNVPYGTASPGVSPFEVAFTYDGFGRTLRHYENGVLVGDYAYTQGNLPFRVSAEGSGTAFASYDTLGNLVWARDAAGNQIVNTLTEAPYLITQSIIRSSGVTTLTTSTQDWLDAAGLPTREVQVGDNGDTRVSAWTRDGVGLVSELTDPQSYVTRYTRDLLGWVKTEAVQRTDSTPPEFDTTSYTYNNRGQVRRITDPSGQTTQRTYDGFGALTSEFIPGTLEVRNSFIYDALGRLDTEYLGASEIKHYYDLRGDPAAQALRVGTQLVPLTERTFDSLGRVSDAVNYNPALDWLSSADRTVRLHVDYDSMGRVVTDQLQVGGNTTHETHSSWSLVSGTWQRQLDYPTQTTWRETYDVAARLTEKARLLPNGAELTTSFNWLGDLYAGRDQAQELQPSPFRERRTFDAFGAALDWQYSALDISSGVPAHPAEGDTYCGGRWVAAACSEPLLHIHALRDSMGRIASLESHFGNPVIDNGNPVTTPQPTTWRGYAYNVRGQLDRVWENQNAPAGLVALSTHDVTTANIETVGSGSTIWSYLREAAVGSTTAIRNLDTGVDRWSLNAARGDGYQVEDVTVGGQAHTLAYDLSGQVQSDGSRTYLYEPRGALAAVKENGALVEAYAYDATGRLAAVYHANANPADTLFAYDGAQIVAAYNGQNQAQWEAAWGPGIDRLIEWRDLAGGTGDFIPLADQRNSIVAAWNVRQTQIAQRADYNPEGRLQLQDSAGKPLCDEGAAGGVCPNPANLPFGFLTAWRSPTTGLVYLRNRWYSPELAQFLSQDPLGAVDSFNLYAYAAFDPINGWDPFGTSNQGFTPASATGGCRPNEDCLSADTRSPDERARTDTIIRPRSLRDSPEVEYEGQLWTDRQLRRAERISATLQMGRDIAASPLSALGYATTDDFDEQLARTRLGGSLWDIAGGFDSALKQRHETTTMALPPPRPPAAVGKRPPPTTATPLPHTEVDPLTILPPGGKPPGGRPPGGRPPGGGSPGRPPGRRVPNPGGRLGDARTRAVTAEVLADLRARGFTDISQERIGFRPGPRGSGIERFPDIIATNPTTGEVEIIQIGRSLASNPSVPVVRERDALDDLIMSPDIQKYPNATIRYIYVDH